MRLAVQEKSTAFRDVAPELRADVLTAQLRAHRDFVALHLGHLAALVAALYAALVWVSPDLLTTLAATLLMIVALGGHHSLGGIAERKGWRTQFAAAALQMIAAFAPLTAAAAYVLPQAEGVTAIFVTAILASASGLLAFAARHLSYAPKFGALAIGTAALTGLMQLDTLAAITAAAGIFIFGWLLAELAEFTSAEITARTLGNRRREGSSRAAQELLAEYEAHGSDWLFAVDERGRLIDVSERFAERAGRDRESLEGKHFVALFDDSHVKTRLTERISRRATFESITLPLTVRGEPAYWRVSARGVPGDRVAMRGIITDVSTEKLAEARVNRIALYDPLTDLPNRSMFEEEADAALADCSTVSRCALLFIDLDHFKDANDLHGHRAGDQLLKRTARRLQEVVGDDGMVARFGGDEFAILISHGASLQEVETLAGRIVDRMSEPFTHDGLSLQATASVGIALAPDDATALSDLLHKADLALYAAKQDGRHCWRRFDPAMDAAARHRKLMDADMQEALDKGEFQLFYQPLVDARTLDLKGFEALIRWISPSRGFVSPGEFIPIAEDTGFIEQLGAWVVRTAIAQAAKWPEHINVAINISPAQLRNDLTERAVLETLDRSRIEASRIELEITEGVLLKESGKHMSMLKRLRARGVRFSLDDFGTGFSSLSYLRTFPFHKIKIDRSFVNDLGESGSQAIVRAVLGLARDLNMVTVAEGIELPGQLAALQQLGCNQIQGFLTGKPCPVDEASKLVEESLAKRRLATAKRQQRSA